MIVSRRVPLIPVIGAALLLAACARHKERKVHFTNLGNGTEVESPFKVEMTAENLVVEPASMGVADGHGHFHIIVDAPASEAPLPVPKDAQHIHYGMGQTEAVLDLPVGDHTLTLQFAHGDHVPYNPQISEEVHIRVTKRNTPPAPAASERAGGSGASTALHPGENGGGTAPDTAVRNAHPKNLTPGGGIGTSGIGGGGPGGE